MNLTEAMDGTSLIRRAAWKSNCWWDPREPFQLSAEDVLADDWIKNAVPTEDDDYGWGYQEGFKEKSTNKPPNDIEAIRILVKACDIAGEISDLISDARILWKKL